MGYSHFHASQYLTTSSQKKIKALISSTVSFQRCNISFLANSGYQGDIHQLVLPNCDHLTSGTHTPGPAHSQGHQCFKYNLNVESVGLFSFQLI